MPVLYTTAVCPYVLAAANAKPHKLKKQTKGSVRLNEDGQSHYRKEAYTRRPVVAMAMNLARTMNIR
jgi:hypothetical protein